MYWRRKMRSGALGRVSDSCARESFTLLGGNPYTTTHSRLQHGTQTTNNIQHEQSKLTLYWDGPLSNTPTTEEKPQHIDFHDSGCVFAAHPNAIRHDRLQPIRIRTGRSRCGKSTHTICCNGKQTHPSITLS